MSSTLGPSIIHDNSLLLILDAADKNSYGGNGSTWKPLNSETVSGTLTNTPAFDSDKGGSFAFNGTNNFVNVVNTETNFNFSNTTFTVSVWIKTASSTAAVIIAKGGVTGGWGLRYNTDGTVTAFLKNGSSTDSATRSTTTSIKNGGWRNVKIIFTTSTTVAANNNIQLYLDSVLNQGALTTSSTYGAESAATVKIASLSGNNYFNGNVSKIHIYSRALTNKEVFQNYNVQKTRFGL
jgi:hypothetical protein